MTKPIRRGPRAIPVPLPAGTVTVYAGARIADALEEITKDMTLYHGVKLAQVVEAVYQQGVRDGRRDVVDAFTELTESKELKHRNPGRPTKKSPRRSL